MALIHDLAESIVGDITPHDNVFKNEKYKLEKEAMNEILSHLPLTFLRIELLSLWEEYNQDESEEARFVKDIDKFEFAFQAFKYRQDHNIEIDTFLSNTKNKLRHPLIKELFYQISHI